MIFCTTGQKLTKNKIEHITKNADKLNAGEETTGNKLPNGYSVFESSLSAASNNKGGLPDGYRRVTNNTTDETKLLGPDGKLYNEVKGANGTNSLQHLSYKSAYYHGTTNNAVKK